MPEYVLWGGLAALSFGAGLLNTVAGGGSLLTLPYLVVVLGLPATVANGTNRIAVLIQSLVAVVVFRQEHIGGTRMALRVLPWACAAALVGAFAATQVDPVPLKKIMGGALLLAAPVLLFTSGRLSGREATDGRAIHPAALALAGLAIGFYGGFLQAAVGIPILLLLIWGARMKASEANHTKVAVVAALTVLSLAVFVAAGQIHPLYGLIAGGAQALGAWLGARIAIRRGLSAIQVGVTLAVVLGAIEMLR